MSDDPTPPTPQGPILGGRATAPAEHTIQWVGMTRNHFEPGTLSRIRMLVIHATAGSYPGDYQWLRNGGDARRPVSIHYYITKTGAIFQMVRDADIAWHCGVSSWVVDGTRINGCNAVALGIELENRNTGTDPYPAAQYDALCWLSRRLIQLYAIPRSQLVRHLDISPGRKTDPAGFPWDRFVAEIFPSEGGAITADSPIMAAARCTQAQALALITDRPHPNYTRNDLEMTILPAYWTMGEVSGVDPCVALAQVIHETGNLSSFWSARPQRNPAGIGVNGRSSAVQPPNPTNWAYNPQRNRWKYGLSFPSWVGHAIPAHLGRLVAWAVRPADRSSVQADLVDTALAYRSLPAAAHGSAPTLRLLGQTHNPSGYGWAKPGARYGAAIATIAQAMREARHA